MNLRLTIIADCVIGLCRVNWNPIEIQSLLNLFATGNRSEMYALVQRQAEMARLV